MADQYEDPIYPKFEMWARATKTATVHDVIRTFLIGYNRASRLIERMEETGELKRRRESWNTFDVCAEGKNEVRSESEN